MNQALKMEEFLNIAMGSLFNDVNMKRLVITALNAR